MPAGYMPAPIGEGGPFVLCPDGLSGASYFLATGGESAGHHDHGPDDPAEGNSWEFCPFGAVFGSFGPVTDFAAAVPSFEAFASTAEPHSIDRSSSIGAFRARAPPQKQPLHT